MSKFNTELEQKCCEAGLRENPVGLSCEERTRHVRHGPACVTAFLSCCHLSETLTREARERQLVLGTSEWGLAGGMGVGASIKRHGVPWNRSRRDLGHGKMGCPSEEPAGPTKGEMQRNPNLCLLLAVDEDEDFEDIFQEDLPVRTLFPESWLWRTFTLPKSAVG